jgi:LysR family transcriptional regulator, regulator for bpeEF and oprC
MPGLQQFMAFAETAKHGGFAAAARGQGVTPSTLAKSVARLEEELGVKLFHRTTRQVTLTPDGERLFQRCQRVLSEVEDLQAEASGAHAAPTGILRVDSSIYYGKRFVLPILADMIHRHPAVRLDIRLTDQWTDLVRDGIDLAVRMGQLRDSTLVARRVDQQSLVLCASPVYLESRGTPQRIEDLGGHAAIAFRVPSTGRQRPWQFRQEGTDVELMPQASMVISDTESLVDALKLAVGLCQLPDHLVENELSSGVLVEVLPSFRPEPMPINLVFPSGRLVPARVRVALEALDALRNRLARTA